MQNNVAVWIVDDDKAIRWVLEKALTHAGITYRSFTQAGEVLTALDSSSPRVLVTDVRMPGESGLDLLAKVKQRLADLPVIIMTAYSDLDTAVAVFQRGAFEYLPKPFDINLAIELITRALRENATESISNVTEASVSASEMLGQASAMQEVFRAIGRLAQSSANVLITGESGTGKELIARALHRHSARSSGPFVAINTAAIGRELLESELFGHEKGAFTGASQQYKGRFEQAEGGSLFLDEIGDMPLDLQAKLLRVLSDGHYYRVGGHTLLKTNARIITATHQDIEQRVQDKLFREDLLHRLNVIRLRLPPLRERHEDIPLLAQHFLTRDTQKLGTEPKRFTPETLKFLQGLDFPGNVRQLENLCHWVCVMTPGQTVSIEDLPIELRTHQDVQYPSWQQALRQEAQHLFLQKPGQVFEYLNTQFETCLIEQALEHTQGKRVEAAQVLGIGRNTLTRKLQEMGLADPQT